MKKAICTIIAKNYLSFARTLCDSFLENNADGICYVLIIDDIAGYVEIEKEKFTLIKLDELAVSDIDTLKFKYNVIELSTALKPYLLKYLLDVKNVNKILYLDPDIMVTNSLDTLYDSLDVSDYIITPHIDTDYPDDGLFPDDAHIMKHGVFNLGFIGIKKCKNTDELLKWWQHKLFDKCIMDPSRGYFVDQKFIDLAITLFSGFTILYDTGYNVAYWNLHSRNISFNNNTWECNGKKLYFYHFSNYKPEKPQLMSREQTRHKLELLPEVKKLYDLYRSKLDNNGYYQCKMWTYTYNYFNDKKVIVDLTRKYYRRNNNILVNNPFNRYEFKFHHRILFSLFALYKKCTKFILSNLR